MLANIPQMTDYFSNCNTTVATRLIKVEHDCLSLRVHPSSPAMQHLRSRSLHINIVAMQCMTTEVVHSASSILQTVTDEAVQRQTHPEPEQAFRNQLSADGCSTSRRTLLICDRSFRLHRQPTP
jgi:hypothetical protein